MDAGLLAALIGAGSGAGVGTVTAVVGHLLSRRTRGAQVELTEAQADEIQGRIYQQLVERLNGEIARLTRRVADLEAKLAHYETQEQTRVAELRVAIEERDRLRRQLAAAQAMIAARDHELAEAKAALSVIQTAAGGG